MGEVRMANVGAFELRSILGRGATGTVYEAVGPDGERVAIKVLDPSLAHDDIVRRRLEHESVLLRDVRNEHCVRVLEYLDDPEPCLVLEYVEGASLRAVLQRNRLLAPRDVVDVVRDMLDGLGAVHARGVVHRDVKPDNLLVDRRGVGKVVDFGIAVLVSDPMGAARRCEGTPAYMSPEQVRGEPLDARSDLYATGCVLYELLTGAPPFTGANVHAVLGAQLDAVPPLEPLPGALRDVTARALSKHPDERFATAAEFRDALDDAARRTFPAAALAAAGGLGGIVAGLLEEQGVSAAPRHARGARVAVASSVVALAAITVGVIAARGSSGPRATRPGSTTAPTIASISSAPTTRPPTTIVAAIDPCLIGRWVDETPIEGGFVAPLHAPGGSLVGGVGIVRTIAPSGAETFDYSHAAPFTFGSVQLTIRGTATATLIARHGIEALRAGSAVSHVTSSISGMGPGLSGGAGGAPPFPSLMVPVSYSCRAGGVTERTTAGRVAGPTVSWRAG